MSGPDPLFDVKNALYLGNWQQCLNEVQKAKTKTEEQKLEQDIFMYRAYTAQKKYGLVSSEIRDSMPAPLQAVKLLAKYHSTTSSSAKVEIAEQVDADFDRYTSDSFSQLIAATIQYYQKNYDLALKVLYKSDDLECMALTVQTFLQLDRLDLARKEYKRMAEKDEYCTLSQLALMSIYLFQAGEKLQDAFFIMEELREKFGPSPLLLNGQAAALIAQGKLKEAEALVQETIDRDPNYTEAIINQMILAQYNNKTELANRLFNQLKDSPGAAGDIYLADYEAKEREFDKICLQYS